MPLAEAICIRLFVRELQKDSILSTRNLLDIEGFLGFSWRPCVACSDIQDVFGSRL